MSRTVCFPGVAAGPAHVASAAAAAGVDVADAASTFADLSCLAAFDQCMRLYEVDHPDCQLDIVLLCSSATVR